MPRSLRLTRTNAVLRIKRHLERDSFPRIQMSLIVGLTGASGLLSSYLMLQAGVTSMALRYPLALVLAYGFFLFLLWLWLRTKVEDYDASDVVDFIPSPGSADCFVPFQGGGGNFGGGGSSASFDDVAALNPVDPDLGSSLGDAVGSVGDAEELAIPLIVLIFVVGLALASFYVIYAAPMLFAELLVDGTLSYALYRKIKGAEPQHWLASAVRRTALPFLLTGIFVAVIGAGLAVYAPEAHSIGQVLRLASTEK